MSSKRPIYDAISNSSSESSSNSKEDTDTNPVAKKPKTKGTNDDEASSSNPNQNKAPESTQDPNPRAPMQPPQLVSPFAFTDSDEDIPLTPEAAPSTPTGPSETSWKPATRMDDSDEDEDDKEE